MNTQTAMITVGQTEVVQQATATKLGAAKTGSRASPSKSVTKSKQDQLIALLSKPNGARISLIIDRLGWQAHTVRAAVSGLRKRSFEIVISKSAKTGEIVYAIKARPEDETTVASEASS